MPCTFEEFFWLFPPPPSPKLENINLNYWRYIPYTLSDFQSHFVIIAEIKNHIGHLSVPHGNTAKLDLSTIFIVSKSQILKDLSKY